MSKTERNIKKLQKKYKNKLPSNFHIPVTEYIPEYVLSSPTYRKFMDEYCKQFVK